MISLKSIKVLLWAKGRRLEALEAAVAAGVADLQACADEVAAAKDHERGCVARVGQGLAAIDRVLGSACFRPEALLALGHVLDGLQAVQTAAAKATGAACQQQAAAGERLALTRVNLQRAQTQRDRLEERRVQLLRDADAAQEDASDEESEEAAVARMVSRRNEAARIAHAARSSA